MRALSADDLLLVWERGHAASLPDRALALLQAACPDSAAEDIARLTIGQRDAGLLKLREQIFGARLTGSAVCPACGERLEVDFRVAEVLVSPFEEPGPAANRDAERVFSFRQAEFGVEFRLPTSHDVAAAAGLDDVSTARRLLLERCLLAVNRSGESQSADALPVAVVDAVAQRMVDLDPQAETSLTLCCSACGRRWKILLDIVSFFWTEIDAWARRTLREVHWLAAAYGWREADILSMSPFRRRLYLDMVGG